ncbi:hypothetical protein SLS56_003414 [Neofusicoccum ribis]|uniref:Uncharacterized protein n=1 Tax=Neofusicoccum ribis TaxID=45134 RepID=A0ABR3T005_9PEZI
MLKSTLAFLFFGVPHQGLAIESLVPLVKDQPNRALLESLNKNSALLQRLDRDFNKAFGARYPHVMSFYETEKSPTAVKVSSRDRKACISEMKEAATALLAYLKRLMNDIEKRSGQVKICFSSRHYPILGLDTLPIICVDERNDRDIRHVIKEKLMEVEPKEKSQQIEKEIILKAQGGFQWAVLVAAIAIEESVNGLKTEGIKEKIKNTPGALDELYIGILRGVPEAGKQQTIKLFQWILFAERPLSAQELREALATNEGMTCTTICELRKHEDWATSSEEFERRVKYLSRGLVEFQTREIWEQYEPGGEDSD